MDMPPAHFTDESQETRCSTDLGAVRSFGRMVRLCRKELREILRDRRTIVTLVLMPLLVYPLLSIVFQRFLVDSIGTQAPQHFVIGLDHQAALPLVEAYLELGGRLLAEEAAEAGIEPSEEQAGLVVASPEIRWMTGLRIAEGVESGRLDLGLRVDPATLEPANWDQQTLRCELVYRKNSPLSQAARDFVSERFRAVNKQFLREQIASLGGRPRLLAETRNRPLETAGVAVSLTALVPLILILMTITGAVYPAIDLTAGERERGTLETLMAAPVPRLGLLAAKYVAVLTVALLTAGANLVAMTVTLMTSGLSELVFGEVGLSFRVVLQILALLVLFAAFFSAILLALTSCARSFKEAQAYLIPLMLLSLAPGMLSLLPGLELSGFLAVVPLVNMVLLARDVLEGLVVPSTAVLAVFSTSLYAVGAVAVAARIFGTDALLYGSEGGWGDLFSRPAVSRPAASLTSALFCTAVLFPASVLLAGGLRQTPFTMTGRLLAGAVATAVLFAGIPWVAAILQRVRFREGFRLRPAHPAAWTAGVLLGLASWPLAHEVFLLNRWFGLTDLTAQAELVAELLDQWRAISPLWIVFSLAVVPGICEELFFRGYLFAALSRVASAGRAVWVSALLFGLFHVVAGSLATPERFLPSLFLGLILGGLAWRSGSVLPGIVMHVVHNALLLLIAYYRQTLIERGWGVHQQVHLPFAWLVLAFGGIALAAGLLWWAGAMRRTHDSVS